MDEQVKQLIMLGGVYDSDIEPALHYYSRRDYVALNELVEKYFNMNIEKTETRFQANNLLRTFTNEKLNSYQKLFEEVPFDVISDNTITKNCKDEEFS